MAAAQSSGSAPARAPDSQTTTRRHLLIAAPALAVAAMPLSAMAASVSPDAEIVAMGRELADILHHLNTQQEDIDENSPRWIRKGQLEDAILASEPQSVAGIAMMLRIVYDHGVGRTNRDDSPHEDGSCA